MPQPNSLNTYVAGTTSLISLRQFSFGSYTFPLTCQMKSNNLKLASDNKKVPFNYGSQISSKGSVGQREIELTMEMGSTIIGSDGVTILATAADLIKERNLIAGLQSQGRQQLWTRDDRYLNAYMVEFADEPFLDAYGFRFSTWVMKFVADDPRYYSAVVYSASSGATLSNVGNVRSYPRISIPTVATPLSFSIAGTGVAFSTIPAGGALAIDCDPRPEHRVRAAVLTTSGVQSSALRYINPSTDLTQPTSGNGDFSQIFPFIDPGTTPTFTCSNTATISWNDTWL